MIKAIAQYIDNNTSFTIGTDLYVGFRPADAAGDCVAVLETTGGIPDYDLTDFVQKPVQVVSRAADYHTARANIQTIYDLLHGMAGVTLPVVVTGDEYYVDTAEAVASPYFIGQDDTGQFEFSANFIFRIQDA